MVIKIAYITETLLWSGLKIYKLLSNIYRHPSRLNASINMILQ